MNPVIMQDGVLAGAEAWAQYLRWRALPGVVFRAEPDRLEDRLGEICLTGGFGHRGLTDAYLAAFARSAGCRMVSFDGAFRRFETLDFLHLEP